jgi:hypothetical protein
LPLVLLASVSPALAETDEIAAITSAAEWRPERAASARSSTAKVAACRYDARKAFY